MEAVDVLTPAFGGITDQGFCQAFERAWHPKNYDDCMAVGRAGKEGAAFVTERDEAKWVSEIEKAAHTKGLGSSNNN